MTNQNSFYVSLFLKNLQQRELICTIQNDRFKVKAYQQAIQKLSALEEATSNIDEELIKKCKFGKSIGDKILFMFKNCTDLPENTELSERESAISEFIKIHNIGLKKGISLYDDNAITSVEMLKENTHLLNNKQRSGLKYHEDIQRRIPRQEISQHFQVFERLKETINFKFVFDVVGSYRRQADDSGDVDILMYIDEEESFDTKPCMKQIVAAMIGQGYIPRDGVFAMGDKKFMGMCRLSPDDHYRRIDILITTKKEFPYCLLYFTGSKSFNILMREQATHLNLILNEKNLSLKPNTEPMQLCMGLEDIQSEEDIFRILNVNYVEPKFRDATNFRISE